VATKISRHWLRRTRMLTAQSRGMPHVRPAILAGRVICIDSMLLSLDDLTQRFGNKSSKHLRVK
jgi:hypothetical protein